MRYRNYIAYSALLLGLVFLLPWQAIGDGATSLAKTIAATQSGTWTVQPGNTANTTAWKVDGSAVTQPVSLASVPSHAVTNAGVFATQNTQQGTASQNVAQLAGTTTDTNSGNKSAGTLRVVLATDQPALTNKLLVTPDANAAVNVAQMNGVTVTMGAGATGTGVQRVNPVSSSATGAAPPASGSYIVGLGSGATGGFLVGVPVADTFKAVSVTSATTTLLVTGVSGRHVRIAALNLVSAIANNVVLISGTGATCGTGTGAIAGGTTAANGWNLAANGGLTIGNGIGTVMQTAAAGDSVCVITSAAGPLAGSLAYAIY